MKKVKMFIGTIIALLVLVLTACGEKEKPCFNIDTNDSLYNIEKMDSKIRSTTIRTDKEYKLVIDISYSSEQNTKGKTFQILFVVSNNEHLGLTPINTGVSYVDDTTDDSYIVKYQLNGGAKNEKLAATLEFSLTPTLAQDATENERSSITMTFKSEDCEVFGDGFVKTLTIAKPVEV